MQRDDQRLLRRLSEMHLLVQILARELHEQRVFIGMRRNFASLQQSQANDAAVEWDATIRPCRPDHSGAFLALALCGRTAAQSRAAACPAPSVRLGR